MKRAMFILMLSLLLVPAGFAWAANDVTISEDTNIYVATPNITIVLKSGSTFSSMTATDSTVAFTLSGGGTVTLSSTAKYILNNDLPLSVSNTCDSSGSSVTYATANSASDSTITFTPGSALCDGGSTNNSGGSSGGSGGTPVNNAQPATGTQSIAKTVNGDNGGSVFTTDNKAGIAIPVGLVSGNTSLNIVPKASSAYSVPANNYSAIASQVYDFTITAGNTPVTTFTKKVSLTFGYTNADVGGIDENSLKVYYWDAVNNKWVEVGGTLNTSLKTVTAEVDHFTVFGLFGKTKAAVSAPVTTPTGTWSVPAGYEYISGPSQLKYYRNIITEPKTKKKYGIRIGSAVATTPATMTVTGKFNTNLSYGMKGVEVKRMQEFLISKGYLAVGLNTGNFYGMTKQAVKNFQKDHKITPMNGSFGPLTRAAANAEL